MKHFLTLHRKLLLISMTLTVVLFFAAYFLKTKQIESHPSTDPSVGFQPYEPQSVPGGFTVTGMRFQLKTARHDTPKTLSLEINIRAEDWVYVIQQTRANNTSHSEARTTLHNFNPASMHPTCAQLLSVKKQEYRLCHWTDSAYSVFEVKFFKDGTYIEAAFPYKKDTPFVPEEFNNFVDSFQKIDGRDIPVQTNTI